MEFKQELINLLAEETDCNIQHNGCPCRTCFYNLCERLGLTNERATMFWQTILILRGDYTEKEIQLYNKTRC